MLGSGGVRQGCEQQILVPKRVIDAALTSLELRSLFSFRIGRVNVTHV